MITFTKWFESIHIEQESRIIGSLFRLRNGRWIVEITKNVHLTMDEFEEILSKHKELINDCQVSDSRGNGSTG